MGKTTKLTTNSKPEAVMTLRPMLRVSCYFECLSGRAHGKGVMRAAVVVETDPVNDDACRVLDAFEVVAVEP